MTTVVGVAQGGGVWMAADTLTNVYDRPITGMVKILRLPLADSRYVLLGISGDAGMPAVVRRSWDVERDLPERLDEMDDWAAQVAAALTEPMLEVGMVEDGRLDGHFLLAVPGRVDGIESTLWTISHHMAIRHADGRGAVGSGEGPAIGALDALLDSGTAPHLAVQQACRIGVERDRWSGLPVQVESLAAV